MFTRKKKEELETPKVKTFHSFQVQLFEASLNSFRIWTFSYISQVICFKPCLPTVPMGQNTKCDRHIYLPLEMMNYKSPQSITVIRESGHV